MTTLSPPEQPPIRTRHAVLDPTSLEPEQEVRVVASSSMPVARPPSPGRSLMAGVYANVGLRVAGALIDAVAPSVSSSDGYDQRGWNELGRGSANVREGWQMHGPSLAHSWRGTDIVAVARMIVCC